jgi:hypothetical protein
LCVTRVAKQRGSAAVFEEFGQLVGVQRGIEWDNRASCGDGSQISCYPPGMVIGHDSQARSARESVFEDPSAHGFGHAAEFGIGAAFNVIVALKFQSDVVRPTLRAFGKTVVESRHGSSGLYTKNVLTAEAAEPAENEGAALH